MLRQAGGVLHPAVGAGVDLAAVAVEFAGVAAVAFFFVVALPSLMSPLSNGPARAGAASQQQNQGQGFHAVLLEIHGERSGYARLRVARCV
jgi:hypothetical protein